MRLCEARLCAGRGLARHCRPCQEALEPRVLLSAVLEDSCPSLGPQGQPGGSIEIASWSPLVSADAPLSFGWAIGIDSDSPTGGSGKTIARDSAGNLYVSGQYTGVEDFDPGPGVYQLPYGGSQDAFIAKYTANGDLLWAGSLNRTVSDLLNDVAVDGAGNVYFVLSFADTLDVDPGPGVVNVTSAGYSDVCIVKLNASGQLVWAQTVGSASSEAVNKVAVSSSGDLAIAGTFNSNVDFDPGPGEFRLSAASTKGYLLRLDTSGNFIWAGALGDWSTLVSDMAFDADGNLYVAGQFQGTVDFDPGTGTASLVSAGSSDAYLLTLGYYGDFGAVSQIGGTGAQTAAKLAIDPADGSVRLAGTYVGTTDFDPGAGSYPLTPADTVYYGYVLALDDSGGFSWVSSLTNTSTLALGGLAVDAQGWTYLAGRFTGTTDFDPGPGQIARTGPGIFVTGLMPAGQLGWVQNLKPGADTMVCSALAIGADGSVYTTGKFAGWMDFDPTPGVCPRSVSSSGGVFIWCLKPRALSGSIWDDADEDSVREAGEPALSGAAVRLYMDNGDGLFTAADSLIRTVVTDAEGLWEVESAAPATYWAIVDESSPPLAGKQPTGWLAQPRLIDWTQEDISGIDFGYHQPTASISGRVWLDADGDGVREAGEAGLTGPAVELFEAGADHVRGTADDRSVSVQAVAGDGTYTFSGLVAGEYFVRFRVMPYCVFSPPEAGGDDSADSDADGIGASPLLSVAAGQSLAAVDAGVGGQAPAFGQAWALGGPSVGNTSESVYYITLDAVGGLVAAGLTTGTRDADPGPGEALLSGTGTCAFVLRQTPQGSLQWARLLTGAVFSVSSVAADGAGNVYLGGRFSGGNVDFDPGPGLAPSQATSGGFVLKLDAEGNFVWVYQSKATVSGLAVDDAGAVTVVGTFQYTVDFDCGPAVVSVTSTSSSLDAYVLRLNAAGEFQWVRTMGSDSTDWAYDACLDEVGNVYVTGQFGGTVDFDPGPATVNLTAGSRSAFVWKLNPAGEYLQAIQLGAGGQVTGMCIALDSNGDIVLAGKFLGTTDLDPGPGTFTVSNAEGVDDAFLVRLTAAGELRWATGLVSTNGYLEIRGLVLDQAGNVYLGGRFSGTLDADPSAGIHRLPSNIGPLWLKYNADGGLVWSLAIRADPNNQAADKGGDILVTRDGEVVVAGAAATGVDFDPSAGLYTLSTLGTSGFVARYPQRPITGTV